MRHLDPLDKRLLNEVVVPQIEAETGEPPRNNETTHAIVAGRLWVYNSKGCRFSRGGVLASTGGNDGQEACRGPGARNCLETSIANQQLAYAA